MCSGGDDPISKTFDTVGDAFGGVVDTVKDNWVDIRDTAESAAVVAGNYVLPGSSLVTSQLVSKGSQEQLNSDLGRIATTASGITGGVNGNTANWDPETWGSEGPPAPTTPTTTPAPTTDPTSVNPDYSFNGMTKGGEGLTMDSITGKAPGLESMGGAQGMTVTEGSMLGDPESFINNPAYVPQSVLENPGIISEAGLTTADALPSLGDPNSFINGGTAGTNLFPWGDVLTGVAVGALGPKVIDAITTMLTPKIATGTTPNPNTLATTNTENSGVMGAGKPGLGNASGGSSGSLQGVANTLLTTKDSGTLG